MLQGPSSIRWGVSSSGIERSSKGTNTNLEIKRGECVILYGSLVSVMMAGQ